jgi:hypothetical protein
MVVAVAAARGGKWRGRWEEGEEGGLTNFQIAAGREGGHEQARAPETEGSRMRTVRARKSTRRPMRKRKYGWR